MGMRPEHLHPNTLTLTLTLALTLTLPLPLTKGRVWSACALRVFCVLQFGEDPQELQTKVVGFLYQMRIDAEVKCVVLSEGNPTPTPTLTPAPTPNPNP